MPGRHAPHLAVLVLDVDEAQVGHDGHRDLGQALDHLAVVDDLGEDLGRQEQELVAAPRLEELLHQLLALGRLGGRMQQLAEVAADGVHQLHHRGVAFARLAAQHLDDPDARAAVADREGVGALEAVLPQRVGHEAAVAHQVGYPDRLAVLHDPAGEALAPAGRVRRLLPCEGGRDDGRAGPHVPADQLLVGREGPQRGHVPVEAPPEGRQQPLGRRVVDRGVGQDLEQLARQLRPALQLPSSRGRKMPTTTWPARGWSNMLRTSSVWTSVPSARLMTASRRRPTRS